MIALGYPNCGACHVHPMGAGILNDYGSVIDEAQSLRGDFYDPESRSKFLRWKTPSSTVLQDVRVTGNVRQSDEAFSFARYANSASWNSVQFYSETFFAAGSSRDEELWLDKAMIGYTISEDKSSATKLFAGEDYLPSGLGNGIATPVLRLPGETIFSNQSNQQVKYYRWDKKNLTSIFAHAPSLSSERSAESLGLGAFFEHYFSPSFAFGGKADLFELGRVEGDPLFATVSSHLRVGLDKKWALLFEGAHSFDVEGYSGKAEQYGGTAQVFYHIYEWLAPSINLQFYEDRQNLHDDSLLFYPEIYFRLTRNLNFSLSERFELSGGDSSTYLLQVAAKL